MAQIVCISGALNKTRCQETGDILGVFKDSHIFSDTERVQFDILPVPGLTAEELEGEIRSRMSTYNLELTEYDDGTGTLKILKEMPKFVSSARDFSPIDKGLLAEKFNPISNKHQLLDKLVDRISELSENQELKA